MSRSTLLLCTLILVAPSPAREDAPAGAKADPVATKLLEEARQARAEWHGFPGFEADLEINLDGVIHKGSLSVSESANVSIVGIKDNEAKMQTVRQLRSTIGHRMPSNRDYKTPCTFPEKDADHPLGRKVRVLNDELHSSYRVRDRQIIVVNRRMRDVRFTITVLKNYMNREKKFLPASYSVSSWDIKSNQLQDNRAYHYTWQRVGSFDLPASILTVTSTRNGKQHSRTITLTNIRLKK